MGKTLREVIDAEDSTVTVLSFKVLVHQGKFQKPTLIETILTDQCLVELFSRLEMFLSTLENGTFHGTYHCLVEWENDKSAQLDNHACDVIQFSLTGSEDFFEYFQSWFVVSHDNYLSNYRRAMQDHTTHITFNGESVMARKAYNLSFTRHTFGYRAFAIANEMVPQIHQWVRTGELANDSVGSQA